MTAHALNGIEAFSLACAMALAEHDAIAIRTQDTLIDAHGGRWYALDDNTYDGEGSPMGWGNTEQEAILDLLEQIAERNS